MQFVQGSVSVYDPTRIWIYKTDSTTRLEEQTT